MELSEGHVNLPSLSIAILCAVSRQSLHLNLIDLLSLFTLRIQNFIHVLAVVAATPLCPYSGRCLLINHEIQ